MQPIALFILHRRFDLGLSALGELTSLLKHHSCCDNHVSAVLKQQEDVGGDTMLVGAGRHRGKPLQLIADAKLFLRTF